MTDRDELLKIADFILNKADEGDLEVIKEALKRAASGRNNIHGVNINKLARTAGETVSKQISFSREQIHNTVTDFVRQLIRQQAPEITDRELEVLVKEWCPKDMAGNVKGSGKNSKPLSRDVELKMIDQFLRFNNSQMSLDEQVQLRNAIPEWQKVYWEKFSPKIRGLLTLYLKGKIDSAACWEEIKKELFDEQKKSE